MSRELKIKGALGKDYQQIYIGDEPTSIFINSEGKIKSANFDSDIDESVIIKPNGNLILDVGADIVINPSRGGAFLKESSVRSNDRTAYGQVWVKNEDPNELCFTDDAGTDIVGIGKYQYETKFVGYYGGATAAYLPMNGYIVEGTTATSRNEYQAFIAPYNGTLVSYYWRSEIAQGGSNHSLRVLEASDGTEIPGTIIYRKDYDPGSIADDTTTAWDFSSPSVGSDPISFTKGRLYQFYVDFAAVPLDTNITLTFKWDITS